LISYPFPAGSPLQKIQTLIFEFVLEPGPHLEEVDVKVSGVRRHLLPPPLVFADIHDAPADHADLNETTPLVNNQGTTRITSASIGVSIRIHPSSAKEPGGDHFRDVFNFVIACGISSISLTAGFL